MDKNKVAIVTGGSEGLGFGIASALAAKGIHVYLVSRTLEKLVQAKAKILEQGGKADVRVADITDMDAMKEVIEGVYREHGRLDIFINNAGAWGGHSLDTPFADIWKLLELDMKAPYQIAHYLAGRFKDEKKNNLGIVSILSQSSIKVLGNSLGYGTAKMALAAGLFHIDKDLEREKVDNVTQYRIYPKTMATEKMMPAIKANQVKEAVKLEYVENTVIDLLEGTTPTRDALIGYYIGRGVVRTFLSSNPEEFYHPAVTSEEILDADFTMQDLME